MSINKMEIVLKAAYTRYAAALAALTKVEEAFPSVPVQNAQKVEEARLKLEDCLASRMLQEATAEDEAQARAELKAAETTFAAEQPAFDTVRLQRVGFNRRLIAAQEHESEAKREIVGAELEWLQEELRIADEAYTREASELYKSFMRVWACADALKSRGVAAPKFSYSDDLAIPSIGPLSCAAVPVFNSHGGSEGAYGLGKLLVNAGRSVQYPKPQKDDVERELGQMMASVAVPKRTNFEKVVSALTLGAKK